MPPKRLGASITATRSPARSRNASAIPEPRPDGIWPPENVCKVHDNERPTGNSLDARVDTIFLDVNTSWPSLGEIDRNTMRKTLLALAAAAALAASAASPAYAGPRYDYGPGDDYGPGGNPYPRTYPGPPNGTPYWSGYVNAPVAGPISPCHWITQRFWDGYAWRVQHARICGQ
jgi:hypothetical protein